MATGNVSVRFSVQDAEVVRQALEKLGKDGQGALDRINAAGQKPGVFMTALSNAVGGVKGQLVGMAAGFGPVGVFLAGLGPVGLAAGVALDRVGAGLSAVSEGAKAFQRYSREVKQGAEQTGLSIPVYQATLDLLQRHGVEADKAATALNRLEVQRYSAARGEGELYKALLRTNAGLADEFAQAKNAEQAVGVLARALSQADETTRAFLTRTAFGRGSAGVGQALLDIAGKGGLGAITEAAKKAGGVFDENLIRKQAEAAVEAERKAKIVENNWNAAYAAIYERWKDFKKLLGLSADNQITVSVNIRQQVQAALSPDKLSTSDLRERLANNQAALDGLEKPSDDAFERAAQRMRRGYKKIADAQSEAQKDDLRKRIAADQAALDERAELDRESHRGRRAQPDLETDKDARARNLKELRDEQALLGDAASIQEQRRLREESLNVAIDDNAKLEKLRGRAVAEGIYQDQQKVVALRESLGIATQAQVQQAAIAKAEHELNKAGITDIQERAQATQLAVRQAIETSEQLQVRTANFRGLKQLELDSGNLRKQLDTLGTESLGNVNSALLDFETGAAKGGDAFKNLEKQVIRSALNMANQMLVLKPAASLLQSLFGSALPSNIVTSAASPANPNLYPSAYGNALGNIFERGNVSHFALGGLPDIVTRPTYFPMANGGTGLAGEAGYPEAVVPLRKTAGGRLGVDVAGGGGRWPQTINHTVKVDVSGARGSKEIQDAVAAGVAQSAAMLKDFSRNQLPGRLQEIQREDF
jgi:hypothetical protein